MIVDIVVDRDGFHPWMERLAAALGSPLREVRLRVRSPAVPMPGAVETLMRLEAIVHRRRGREDLRATCDLVPFDARDLVADCVVHLGRDPLCSAGDAKGRRVLQPRFDGALGDLAIADALLDGRSPSIEIEDAGRGSIVAEGRASLEMADGLAAGLDSVGSRAAILLVRCLDLAESGQASSPSPPGRRASPVTPVRAARSLSKGVVSRAARAAYRLCFRAPHWRVGWRRTDEGVWDRRDLGGVRWNVLPDPGHHFYADPFALRWRGRDFLFFEDLDHHRGKGIISCAEIGADGSTGPVVPVVEEPWHLSYPFLIEHGGEIFMIPESSTNREVAIYRAVDFPHRWEHHAQLLSGVEAADATVVRHEGRYWMFAVTREGVGGYSDTLSIYHAPDLFGPWEPHCGNPVLVDPASTRPAGHFVRCGGHLHRPVQDCVGGYGTALALARIDRLDPEGFGQHVETILRPGPAWPGHKLHTLNRAGRLETIDGAVFRPKIDGLARWTERRFLPAA